MDVRARGGAPDLFVDGLCCDYITAHELAHAGLIGPAHRGRVGPRMAAVLTAAGRAELVALAAEPGWEGNVRAHVH